MSNFRKGAGPTDEGVQRGRFLPRFCVLLAMALLAPLAMLHAQAITNGSYTVTPQNATGLRLDDYAAKTTTGNEIDVYTSNGTAAQTWAFSDTSVVPAGYYNIAVSLGAFCLTASGTTSGSAAVLDPCAGTTAQAWEAVVSGSFFVLHPASNTALCLTASGTASASVVDVDTCSGATSQEWAGPTASGAGGGGGGGSGEGPYPSTAAAIPGTVMAENYDTGGQGVAYNVTSTNGSANSYRAQGVDLEAASAPATGDDLGWSAAGQWFKYTVNVSTAGSYKVSFMVSSESAIADAFHLSNASGTNLSGSVAVADSGGWQTWETVTATVTLPAGTQTLTLNDDAAGWNIDSMAFASSSGGGGGGTSGEGPYPSTAAAIPGTVMNENYDTGGQGVGYNVTSTNGSANSYRSQGVDLEAASSPATGDDLGWSAAGQWFRYTVNVSTAGTYTISFLVASESAIADAFHLSNSSGTNLTGSVAVPNTGGWQTWQTVMANATLSAGTQTLTLSEDAGGWNIDSMAFASGGSTGGSGPPGGQPPPGGSHPRLKIISGCAQPMWVQHEVGNGGGTDSNPNFVELSGVGQSQTFEIPDIGLSGFRVWPGFGCNSAGQNCTVGSSGGPASSGFSCPPGIGCAPPIDSLWEGSFGCIPGAGGCQGNSSAPGTTLGPYDWWDASFVDGYTTPIKVVIGGSGYCPTGPQPNDGGPGGPPGGVFDCSNLRFANCPTNENLSTNGEFPALSSENLKLYHPNADGTPSSTQVGCYSPDGKLTFGQWQAIPTPPFTGTYYQPASPQAEYYACPTPPISPAQCSAGPAASTQYTKMIHATCNAYAYPYDDAIGLSTCIAQTGLVYDVTFYCPE
jgi:hypothetical protein